MTQHEKQPENIEQLAIHMRPMEIHVQVMGEEGHDEEHVEHDKKDERMVLTPKDQEILLQQLGGDGQRKVEEIEKVFEEKVFEKLEEIARQQRPDPDQVLQANLAQQVVQLQQKPPTPLHQQEQQDEEHQEEEQEKNIEAHRITMQVIVQGEEQEDSMPQ